MTQDFIQAQIDKAIDKYGQTMTITQATEWLGISRTTWHNKERAGENMPKVRPEHGKLVTAHLVQWHFAEPGQDLEPLPPVDSASDVLKDRGV